MYKKEQIDLLYRFICLVLFWLVIILSRNVFTLIILSLFFFLSIKNENNLLYTMLFFITFCFFAIAYSNNMDYHLSKIVIIISYTYYFLIIPSASKKIKMKVDNYLDHKYHLVNDDYQEKSENNDSQTSDVQEYLRFSQSYKKKTKKKNDLPTTIYVTYHLVVLFLAIVLGGVILK